MAHEPDRVTVELQALAAVLEAYGANTTRWSLAARQRFAALIAENSQAQRLVADAEALDRLLDQAPAVAAKHVDAAKGRIFSEMGASPVARPGAAQADNVVAIKRPVASLAAKPAASRSLWREAMVLAAALVLGVFAGTAGLFEAAGISIPGLTEQASDGEYDVSEVALGGDASGAGEEERL
jgi:hypothetical protein